MAVLVPFLAAASEVARSNTQRISARRALLSPFLDAVVSQAFKDAVNDTNSILSSVGAPNLPGNLAEVASGNTSRFFRACFHAVETSSDAASSFLDRLHRACSED